MFQTGGLGFYKQATHSRPGDQPFFLKGPKGTKMVNLSVFDHLGLLQTKMNFLSQMDKIGFGRGASALGAKKIIFFK